MGKSAKHLILIILSLLVLAIFIGYNMKNSSEGTFSIEQFQSEMKSKNYNFEMKDVEKDFLPTTRKRMLIGNEALDIYLFCSNMNMENEAKHITSDGFGYRNDSRAVQASWIAPPHFYKRGSIIVQYVGESQKIISDLKFILGKQFAGDK